jgi:hypothetical protein
MYWASAGSAIGPPWQRTRMSLRTRLAASCIACTRGPLRPASGRSWRRSFPWSSGPCAESECRRRHGHGRGLLGIEDVGGREQSMLVGRGGSDRSPGRSPSRSLPAPGERAVDQDPRWESSARRKSPPARSRAKTASSAGNGSVPQTPARTGVWGRPESPRGPCRARWRWRRRRASCRPANRVPPCGSVPSCRSPADRCRRLPTFWR